MFAIVVEMKKVLAGSDLSSKSSAGGSAPTDNKNEAEQAESKQSKTEAPADGDAVPDESDSLLEGSPRGEKRPRVDPVVEHAMSLADKDEIQINMHVSVDSFMRDVQTRIFPSAKIIVFLDAQTSRPPLLFAFLSNLTNLPGHNLVFIPVGRRYQLLAGMMEKLQAVCPGRTPFVVQRGTGQDQSERNRPSYAVFLPAANSSKVPQNVRMAGCPSRASEGLRLACTSPTCPGRPTGAGSVNVMDEVDAADKEATHDLEDMFTEEEDPTLDADADRVQEAMDNPSVASPQDAGTKVKTTLFPFANPISYYKKLLLEALDARSCTHILIYSRTSHPSLIAAARMVGLNVTALHESLSQHSMWHGARLLRQFLIERHMVAARTKVGPISRMPLIAKNAVHRRAGAADTGNSLQGYLSARRFRMARRVQQMPKRLGGEDGGLVRNGALQV